MKKNEFTAVVPVAGAGTRLRPHTYTYPKVLLTVGDKPIIGHILDDLAAAGIKKVCMVTGYLGDKIKFYVSSAYPGLEVDYVEQPEPKGLGHAIWLTRGRVTGPVLVMLGDTILSADLSKFLGGREDCIAVKEVADPRRFGVVEVRNGYISAMVEKPEKPRTNLAIVGIYSFRNSSQLYGSLQRLVDSGTTTRGEIQFTDAMAMMVRSGHRIKPVRIEGWYDCGKPETLLETNRYILGRGSFRAKAPGTLIVPPVYISPGAEVRDSIIGPHVSVGPGCRIERSIISDTIINEGAQVSDMNLAGSLIGPSAVAYGRRYKLNVGENSEVVFEAGAQPE
ncbi:MAG: sugar phosphate nucleotidyltransferase [Elusimicrobiales bacterium]|jgi:glucose-1-phosphate thymidylyltransferase|nr:sugar phosphate nucleotidyltransferase [Elusimicrobiales bacterium]